MSTNSKLTLHSYFLVIHRIPHFKFLFFTFKVNTATGQISGAAPRTVNGKAAKALIYQGLLVRPALDTYDGAPLLGGGYLLGAESSGVVELITP